ncbi:MAG: DUF2780 domain-containing protein [Candidatus Thiodiazotropha sp. (ex Lucinoma annulata)]|nr:DUF2780 domain-containing protein [Candidatus Thiodiazotropha sp. (ex Lucinoma annulata)]
MEVFRNLALSLLLLLTSSAVSASGLLDALTSQLGVTSEQAAGGAGSLFNLAKSSLAPSDFSQIASVVPGIDSMMSAAPVADKASGGVGAVASMLGGEGSLGNLANLASSFSELGLSSDMIGKFTPVVLEYLQSAGGDTVMEMMKGALTM